MIDCKKLNLLIYWLFHLFLLKISVLYQSCCHYSEWSPNVVHRRWHNRCHPSRQRRHNRRHQSRQRQHNRRDPSRHPLCGAAWHGTRARWIQMAVCDHVTQSKAVHGILRTILWASNSVKHISDCMGKDIRREHIEIGIALHSKRRLKRLISQCEKRLIHSARLDKS